MKSKKMIAPEGLRRSFLGVQGAIFQKSPLVAEGISIKLAHPVLCL